MAFVYGDRVQETSTTSGVGAMTLGGAVAAYRTFAAGIGVGNQCYYTITNDADTSWEVGIGSVGAGTLSRSSILSSSNGNLIVNFAVGTKRIFSGVPAALLSTVLTTVTHAALDHTGIPGVSSFTSAVHALTNHTGLPGVPAPESFTAVVHSTTDHTGIPGVSAVPTATAWGVNTETLAADKTLTDSSPTLQFLDPGGADRIVNLPAVAAANRQMLVYNSSPAAARLRLFSGGVNIGTVWPWCASRLYSNGVRWIAGESIPVLPSTALNAVPLYFSHSGTPGVAAYAAARVTGAPAGLDVTSRVRMPMAGQITRGFVTPATTTGSFAIVVNGSVAATVPYGNTATNSFVVSPPVAFVAGDTIAIQHTVGTAPAAPNYCLFANASSPTGTLVWWGGNFSAGDGPYLNAGSSAMDAGFAGTVERDALTTLVIPARMRATALSWDWNAAVTFNLYRSGQSIFSAATAANQSSLAVDLAPGDTLSVAGPAGGAYGNVGVTLDWQGPVATFAGHNTAGVRFYRAFGSPSNTSLPVAASGNAVYVAPAAGRLRYITLWMENSALLTHGFNLVINGAVALVLGYSEGRAVALSTATVFRAMIWEVSTISIAAGDQIAISQGAAVAASGTHLALWMQSE